MVDTLAGLLYDGSSRLFKTVVYFMFHRWGVQRQPGTISIGVRNPFQAILLF